MKKTVTFILLAFVFTSFGMMLQREISVRKNLLIQTEIQVADPETPPAPQPDPQQPTPETTTASQAPTEPAVVAEVAPLKQIELPVSNNDLITTQITAALPEPKLTIYYFHGNKRCKTCKNLEAYAFEALDTNFKGDLTAGDIKWKVVNVEEPANSHFINDYQLITRSVVISKTLDGVEIDWKNLDKIWDLVSDKQKYLDYIETNVSEFKEEKK